MILANLIEESYQFHQNKKYFEESDLTLIEEAFFKHITDTFNKFKDKIINLDPFNVRKTEVKFDPSRRKFLNKMAKVTPAAVLAPKMVAKNAVDFAEKLSEKYNSLNHLITSEKEIKPSGLSVSPDMNYVFLKPILNFNKAMNSAYNLRSLMVNLNDLQHYKQDFINQRYDKIAQRYIVNKLRKPFLQTASSLRPTFFTHANPIVKHAPKIIGFNRFKQYNQFADKYNKVMIPVHDTLMNIANEINKLKG